jgi:hypothetical protein
MTIWQRRHRHQDVALDGLDARIVASRATFVADHDATVDFEAEWAGIVARAEATPALDLRSEPAAVPDGDPASTVALRGPRGSRSRPGRRLVVAGAVSMAAAALVAAFAIVGSGSGGSAGEAERDLVPRIISETRSALANSVEYEVTDSSDTPTGLDTETWRDQTGAAVRMLSHIVDGRGPSLDWGPVTPPAPDATGWSPGPHPQRAVDYCFREYTVENLPIRDDATDVSASVARSVTEGLHDGRMRTDGTEVVDGRELIRVIERSDPDINVWYVDPSTYRPVRHVYHGELDPGSAGGPVPAPHMVTTIEYLPRSPELLAQFSPVVPEGFARVDRLTRTDDSMPGCQ